MDVLFTRTDVYRLNQHPVLSKPVGLVLYNGRSNVYGIKDIVLYRDDTTGCCVIRKIRNRIGVIHPVKGIRIVDAIGVVNPYISG